jgi:hypothetical protein
METNDLQPQLPEWESLLIEDAIQTAERRYRDEQTRQAKAKRRALELSRQQGYHRLALAIDRPQRRRRENPGQLSFFPKDPTLFDEPA